MEKKIGLISSMMKRLGVTPCEITLHFLQNKHLSFDCLVKDENACKSIVKSSVSIEHSIKENPEEEENIETEIEQIETISVNNKNSASEEVETKEDDTNINLASVFFPFFYKSSDDVYLEEFKLNGSTISMVRCGMVAYEIDNAIVIRKVPMPLSEQNRKRARFKGVIFATHDNDFLAMKLGDGQSNFKKAIKKLPSGYTLPRLSDCEVIFINYSILYETFKKMNVNLNRYNEYFYIENKISNEEPPCVFNFIQGNPVHSPKKSAIAGSIQITVIKK